MELFRQTIVDRLLEAAARRKNDGKMRAVEGLTVALKPSATIVGHLTLKKMASGFDPVGGRRPAGWFYDHRANRRWASRLAEGRRVLDLYSWP
jgi:23S rRNA (cytosine1962-C5)-methyltransferase